MDNSMFNINDQLSTLEMLTLSYRYAGQLGEEGNGFRVFMKFPCLPNYQINNFLLIVTPVGGVNPRSKAVEIYNTILNTAMQFNINPDKIKVVLDLLGLTGIGKDHLFEWRFKEVNGQIEEEITTKKFLQKMISCFWKNITKII